MPDIRLVQNTNFLFPYAKSTVSVDWLLLDDGSLDETQALATAVIVALGTDALADPSDILPDPDSTDRRGWFRNLGRLGYRLQTMASHPREDRWSGGVRRRDRGAG